ncbi:MAG: DUF2568 domain-containing protein [Micrococcales bacterium]|nr:DUF2568 domain-containing protein [Micrococcales bacterium]
MTRPDDDRSLVPGGHRLSTPGLVALAAVAFVVELALFGGVAVVTHDLVGGGASGWALGVLATVVVLVLWGLFMAPKGRRRLRPGPRTAWAVVLVYAVALGLLAGGHTGWAWFVGVAGLAVVAAQTVLHEAAPAPPAG